MVDYSNIKTDMTSLNAYFRDKGVKVTAEDTAKLNTIFQECDTEGAKNENGENIGDGVLKGEERVNFLSKIKTACPKLFNKIVEFFKEVEITEFNETNKKETQEKVDLNLPKLKEKQEANRSFLKELREEMNKMIKETQEDQAEYLKRKDAEIAQ